jgi:hypothetical protein
MKLFLDSVGGGAWPFVVGGAICLVHSDNERDSGLLTRRRLRACYGVCQRFLEGRAAVMKPHEVGAITGL